MYNLYPMRKKDIRNLPDIWNVDMSVIIAKLQRPGIRARKM